MAMATKAASVSPKSHWASAAVWTGSSSRASWAPSWLEHSSATISKILSSSKALVCLSIDSSSLVSHEICCKAI